MLESVGRKGIFWGALLLAWLPLAGCADSVHATNSRCLQGSWIAEREAINRRGVQVVAARLVLEKVQGNLLSGESSWGSVRGDGGFAESELVVEDVERVIGAVSPYSDEFYLVEQEETGIYRGRIVGENQIEVFLTQSGPYAVVGFSRMVREGEAPEGCG